MLHIRQIQLRLFATHDETKLNLPAKGLVAITGGNGSGKSSLLEAVSIALWNESLRGEPGWREGQKSLAQVITDRVSATRSKVKASAKLEWDDLDSFSSVQYETTTKAQAALDAVIGSYDVWRRTCVLSSLDSAAFSLARDSDRKRLLEEFLGLGMFDVALEACRQDRKAAAQKADKAREDRNNISLQLVFARRTLKSVLDEQENQKASGVDSDLASLKSEGTRLAAMHKAVVADAQAAAEKMKHLERAGLEEDAKAKAEESRLVKLGKDACPTCGQDTSHAKQHISEAIADFKAKAQAIRQAVESQLQAAKDEVAELADESNSLSEKLERIRSDYRMVESQSKQVAFLAGKVKTAQAEVAKWEAAEAAQGKDSGDLDAKVLHLEAVEQVLGLRGVRAQVLDHALGALEKQANAWLSRMPTEAGPLTITLTGSTAQKSGSVVDAISLKVRGRPYASCSGGERRRVDVAILLALRELAVAAHGRDGTLFCDEVFDALDQQGQADVATALREMSDDRLVVVITHSPDLLKALQPDMHVTVALHEGAAKIAVSK